MRTPGILLLLAGGALAGERDLSNLVGGLGSEDPAVRERSSEALRQLGEEARPDLLEAAKSPDAEVRARAEELLAALEAAKAPPRKPAGDPNSRAVLRIAPPRAVAAPRASDKAVVVERRVPSPELKATFSECTEDLKSHLKLDGGVVVRAAEAGSALEPHDILLELDGVPVKDLAALSAALEKEKKEGRRLLVLRRGERKELVLGRMPE